MRLTYRDKVLLLAFILIAVWGIGIWFFIRPKAGEIGKANDNLEAVNATYDQVQIDLEAAKSVKDECNEIIKQAKTDAEGFYGVMRAYEAERVVAELLANTSNPISIDGMTISGPTPISITPYSYSVNNSFEGVATVGDIDVGTAEEVTGNDENVISVETVGCYNYSVNFTTTKAFLQDFLDKIPTSNNKSSLVVNTVSIGEYRSGGGADDPIEGTMSFTLYFVNVLDIDNVDQLFESAAAAE